MRFFSKNQNLYIESQISVSDGQSVAEGSHLTSQVKAAVKARMKRGQGFRQAVKGVVSDMGLHNVKPSKFYESSSFRMLGLGLVLLLALLLSFFAFGPNASQQQDNKAALHQQDIAAPSSNTTIHIQFHTGTTIQSMPASGKQVRRLYGTP
ncbi:MAG: hypothetical protein AAFV95_26595 [Bacteroidota bacterium]